MEPKNYVKDEQEKSRIIPDISIPIAPAKMFTYPTRLAASWRADIMEINLPAYNLDKPKAEVAIFQGSTRSLKIKSRNIFKNIYRTLAAPIQMDNEYVFDSRYDTDRNIAHIITNVAARALVAKEMCSKVTVILRANASTMAREAYRLLGFPVICTNKEVRGKLILISSDSSEGTFEGLYSSLFGSLDFEGFNKQTPEKVFISRKGTRSLINEHEVEQTLQRYGFKKLYFEDIPLIEQWSVAKNAKVIVGLHGAALSSLVFNCSAVKVVELFHPGYVVNMYRHTTNIVGGKWCGVTGQLHPEVIRDLDFKQKPRSFALTPTRIDTTSLCLALQHLEVGMN